MRIRLTVLLVFAAALTGCGTRSIIVPIVRPALIDFHRCGSVLLLPCDVSNTRWNVEEQSDGRSLHATPTNLADDINAALHATLNTTIHIQLVSDVTIRTSDLFGTPRRLSATLLGTLKKDYNASCVLAIQALEFCYSESLLRAQIQSPYTQNSEKRVRMARASLVLGVFLINATTGQVVFADSARSDISRETHATDQDPTQIDVGELQWLLVNQVVFDIAEAARPLRDRELVTFLLDNDYPQIKDAIELAELGRWTEAAALLDSMVQNIGKREGTDKLWYNLGLLRQYSGDFAAAMTAFQTAGQISDNGRYKAAIEHLLRAEEEYLEHRKQEL